MERHCCTQCGDIEYLHVLESVGLTGARIKSNRCAVLPVARVLVGIARRNAQGVTVGPHMGKADVRE